MPKFLEQIMCFRLNIYMLVSLFLIIILKVDITYYNVLKMEKLM